MYPFCAILENPPHLIVMGLNESRQTPKLHRRLGYPNRRVAIRYDKLATNYLAMIQLSATRIWLRTYESTA